MFNGRNLAIYFFISLLTIISSCGGGGSSSSPPTANSLKLILDEDTSVSETLSGLAGEGGSLSFNLVTMPINGELALNGNQFTYTPNQNYFGDDSFTFVVKEGALTSLATKVSLTVTAVNDPPSATDTSFLLDEDTELLMTLGIVDIDNELLTINIETQTVNGVLAINADNSVTYIPDLNFNGSDSFVFTANDDEFATLETTVLLSVAPVNDIPTLFESTQLTVLAGSELEFDLLGGDVDGDSLTYQVNQNFEKALITNDYEESGLIEVDIPYGTYGEDVVELKANDGEFESEVKTLSLNISVPETEVELTHHRYEARGSTETLDVLTVENKIIVVGNVNGIIGDTGSEPAIQHFFAIHNADNDIEKIVYFSEGELYFEQAHLFMEDGLVYMIAFRDTDAFIVGLTQSFDIKFNHKITIPYAIIRDTKNFDVVHVEGVGFYLIGNDNQVTFVDFDGDVISTKSIENNMGFEIYRWTINDSRQINDDILISGSFYVCTDEPENCQSGSGNGSFLLKMDKDGTPLSVDRLLEVYADDSAILSDGRVVLASDEILSLVDVDGSLVWTRANNDAFGAVLKVDANDHIYWWSPHSSENAVIATRVDANNELQWKTDLELGRSEGSGVYPLQMVIDNVGNMYVSYIEQLENDTVNIRDFHVAHIDYAGTHQWTQKSVSSRIDPNTSHVRVTAMTEDKRFVAIGNDTENSHIYSYLFIAKVLPKL